MILIETFPISLFCLAKNVPIVLFVLFRKEMFRQNAFCSIILSFCVAITFRRFRSFVQFLIEIMNLLTGVVQQQGSFSFCARNSHRNDKIVKSSQPRLPARTDGRHVPIVRERLESLRWIHFKIVDLQFVS